MIRFIVAASFAALVAASPVVASAQTDAMPGAHAEHRPTGSHRSHMRNQSRQAHQRARASAEHMRQMRQ